MNIQNIIVLEEQLLKLGFETARESLLKIICFKPDNFLITNRIEKGKDKLVFQLFFERDTKQNVYKLSYYDAILQKEAAPADVTINGITISDLEKTVGEIDWKTAFDFNVKKLWDADDKASWEQEQKIEGIIEAFAELEKSDEGKAVVVDLKLKNWNSAPYQELFGNIRPLQNKSEVSQRFYFFEGQTGISVDEAYRFLQNRWMEKQMQAKRKYPVANNEEELTEAEHTSSGNGLLQKKRLNISKRANKKNSNLKK